VNATELALVLGSALLHAWWSVSIKGSRDPLAFNLAQKAAPVLLLLAALPWVDLREVPRPVWTVFAGTSVAHGVYFYWMSRAFERGDLTLVYPIARSTPAFLPFVAVPLLGEDLSGRGALGIATVVAGMWCVHPGRRPSWRELTAPAVRFAYLTLAATVAYSLLDKAAMAELASAPWSSRLPRAVFYCLLLYPGSALVFVPLVWRRRGRPVFAAARRELRAATLAFAVSLVGYSLILAALETAPASYVVAARQTSVLFALALGMAFLGERPGRRRAFGAALTVAGVGLLSLG